MTDDMLKRIGTNVGLQETRWGSVVKRRFSMQSVKNGGWNV